MINNDKKTKKPRDLNLLAASIVEETTDENQAINAALNGKNPHAVAVFPMIMRYFPPGIFASEAWLAGEAEAGGRTVISPTASELFQ